SAQGFRSGSVRESFCHRLQAGGPSPEEPLSIVAGVMPCAATAAEQPSQPLTKPDCGKAGMTWDVCGGCKKPAASSGSHHHYHHCWWKHGGTIAVFDSESRPPCVLLVPPRGIEPLFSG